MAFLIFLTLTLCCSPEIVIEVDGAYYPGHRAPSGELSVCLPGRDEPYLLGDPAGVQTAGHELYRYREAPGEPRSTVYYTHTAGGQSLERHDLEDLYQKYRNRMRGKS